jgi:hypothetical protein
MIYFYLQQTNEKDALKTLLIQHISMQNQSGKSIANGISSDLNSIYKMIENVAHIQALKEKFNSNITKVDTNTQDIDLIKNFLDDQINSTYHDLSKKADRMYILNKNGTL